MAASENGAVATENNTVKAVLNFYALLCGREQCRYARSVLLEELALRQS